MTFNNTTPTNFFDTSANARASSSPFVDIFQPRDPTPFDITSATSINNYPIQQKWFNTAVDTIWELKNYISSNGITTANWIKIGGATFVETLTGNSGGAVTVDTMHNINVIGDGIYIKTVGNLTPDNHTLLIEPAGGLTTMYVEDSGTATPMNGVLNIFGGTGITTSGSGNTVTISSNGSLSFNYTNVSHASSPYTVLGTDEYISVDCSAGVVTLNFPNAPTFKKTWIVKDRTGNCATNNITLTTPGGVVTFDGQTSLIMDSNYMALNIIANATPTYEVF